MAIAPQEGLNLGEEPPSGLRTIDSFDILRKIGEGSYGIVYEALDLRTGERVALKKLKTKHGERYPPQSTIREIESLQKLHHENVVQLKELVISIDPRRDEQETGADGNRNTWSMYMVLEYMDHNLAKLSQEYGTHFTAAQIKCYMKQLLAGLHHCHINQVMHRDIKGSNIMINNLGILKLGDFGLSREFLQDRYADYTSHVGTLKFKAPEILFGAKRYREEVDMWSVGCVFGRLLLGRPILQGLTEADQLTQIFALCGIPNVNNWAEVVDLPLYDNLRPRWPLQRRISEVFRQSEPEAVNLLDRMLSLNPSQRISAKDALEHDYFKTPPLPADPRSKFTKLWRHTHPGSQEHEGMRRNHRDASVKGAPFRQFKLDAQVPIDVHCDRYHVVSMQIAKRPFIPGALNRLLFWLV